MKYLKQQNPISLILKSLKQIPKLLESFGKGEKQRIYVLFLPLMYLLKILAPSYLLMAECIYIKF